MRKKLNKTCLKSCSKLSMISHLYKTCVRFVKREKRPLHFNAHREKKVTLPPSNANPSDKLNVKHQNDSGKSLSLSLESPSIFLSLSFSIFNRKMK